MDPTRDNPIIRFNTFWWALWTFLSFAVLLAGIIIYNRQPPTNLEDAAAVARYASRDKVSAAQAAALSGAEIAAAIPQVAAGLLSDLPTAVEKPEQVVPGSPTALKMAAESAPTGAPAAPGESPPVPTPAPVPAAEEGGQDARPTAPAPVVTPPAEVSPSTGTPVQP
ncbi:MAG: hypothetical protein NTW21_10295 [Verrucomicrobia bacterium]|nr:hypothetical protein [Verrucomicrobiota bacterium]